MAHRELGPGGGWVALKKYIPLNAPQVSHGQCTLLRGLLQHAEGVEDVVGLGDHQDESVAGVVVPEAAAGDPGDGVGAGVVEGVVAHVDGAED